MSLFLRLLGEEHKGAALEAAIRSVVAGELDGRVFEVEPDSFEQVPGAPFAYWVSGEIRSVFRSLSLFETAMRKARRGTGTNQDFRFLRLRWETLQRFWIPHAKGGEFSPYYSDLVLSINWRKEAEELRASFEHIGESPSRNIRSESDYLRPGLTWPRRTTSGLSLRVMPAGCIFGD